MTASHKVLLVAFHYPPAKGGSGIQRTLKYSRYLGRFGWNPVVLTVSPLAHDSTSREQLDEIPADVPVYRAFGLNAAKHLSVMGRYPSFMALPDRWASWVVCGVVAGLFAVARHRPRVIWSTYPIASTHIVGMYISRLARLPWISDFRDPMCQDGYPRDARQWKMFKWIEERAVRESTLSTFTAPSTLATYATRYPGVDADRLRLIPNGYDEADFGFEAGRPSRDDGREIVLLHSGTMYPEERDPRPFFEAVARLRDEGDFNRSPVRIVLRATGHDEYCRGLLDQYGLGGLVDLKPPIPYREALREMVEADGLLLFQGSNCNAQIPAKVYEYLRAGVPIFALTDPRGDTGKLLLDLGVPDVAESLDRASIGERFKRFIGRVSRGEVQTPDREVVKEFSREAQAGRLAELLSEVAGVRRS